MVGWLVGWLVRIRARRGRESCKEVHRVGACACVWVCEAKTVCGKRETPSSRVEEVIDKGGPKHKTYRKEREREKERGRKNKKKTRGNQLVSGMLFFRRRFFFVYRSPIRFRVEIIEPKKQECNGG